MGARGQTVPPLIEHGGLVEEARGPKGFTSRFIGVCNSIQQEAARHMKEREHHAVRLPSMVDLDEFSAGHRTDVRAEFAWSDNHFVAAWVGRLDIFRLIGAIRFCSSWEGQMRSCPIMNDNCTNSRANSV